MKAHAQAVRKKPMRETLTEAYEVRAFRDELDMMPFPEAANQELPHGDPRDLQAVKAMAKGHGEQRILPDDCQFGDNDLCNLDE